MGYGDDIMATAAARVLHQARPDVPIIFGDGQQAYWSPVFNHNPRLASPLQWRWRVEQGLPLQWVANYPNHRPYINYRDSVADRIVFNDFAVSAGELYFSPEEIKTASSVTTGLQPFAVIEPNVKGSFSANKSWGIARYQAVVQATQHQIRWVQLGARGVPSLRGVQRLITPDFRSAAAILAQAKFYLGPEGGLHHAAAALGKPAVVIFGGYISPETTGYPIHYNLFGDIPGTPCGMLSPCAHCRRAMQSITVQDVITHVELVCT